MRIALTDSVLFSGSLSSVPSVSTLPVALLPAVPLAVPPASVALPVSFTRRRRFVDVLYRNSNGLYVGQRSGAVVFCGDFNNIGVIRIAIRRALEIRRAAERQHARAAVDADAGCRTAAVAGNHRGVVHGGNT